MERCLAGVSRAGQGTLNEGRKDYSMLKGTGCSGSRGLRKERDLFYDNSHKHNSNDKLLYCIFYPFHSLTGYFPFILSLECIMASCHLFMLFYFCFFTTLTFSLIKSFPSKLLSCVLSSL